MDNFLKKKEKKSIVKRLCIFISAIAFFLTIVLVYYFKLYSETEENILNTGRINAIESSHQINSHVSSSIGVLRMCSYMLDSMVKEKKPVPEIMGFFTGLTKAIKTSLIPDSTGLYGYIYGQYMDGAGWVPEEGYEPTERVWYKVAMAAEGELVLVDPYVDAYTGNNMISVVKALSDGESVVGLDLTIDQLQSIMKEHVSEKGIYAEFVVNARDIVVAHSDNSLVGTDYSDEGNPLGKLIAEGKKSSEDNFFYLDYKGGRYLVYYQPLLLGWTCVTIIDATSEYANLRIPIIICVFTALVVIGVMAFFLMQSDKKSREAYEMAILSEKATAASDAKSTFLSNMSHEIRTPINAILGMNEMILRESEQDSIIQYSENIRNAGRTLLGLINDILDFSKIEAGKIDINPVNYDLSSVLNDLVNMISSRADEKGLQLILDFDRNIPVSLNGDEIRIKQIITNILTNAVKYTKKGSVTFKAGYEKVESEPDCVMINISITDTGIGIKEEDIKKLFIEFERIEEKRNRNIEGTGLGMTITKSLLEMMGSSLKVDSKYGKGSTFSFSLKQKVVDWNPLGDYAATYQKHLGMHSKYEEKLVAPDTCLLVVDDNPLNLIVFKSLLKDTQIKIDTADSGDEGLALAAKKAYDVIFMDHMMPGKDGIETLHELRSVPDSPNRKTPVICVTANAVSGARDEYIREGFDDYLTKPIDSDKLEEMLIGLLPEKKVNVLKEKDINGTFTDPEEERISKELEPIKKQGLIDIEAGLKNSGSYKGYYPILKTCSDFANDWIKDMDNLFKSENYNEYTIKVHAVKSSLRTIGATKVAVEAQELENAGKRVDISFIKSHHEDFIKNCRSIKVLLNMVFKKEDDSYAGLPIADDALLATIYENLLRAAMDMDCDSLDTIFEEMEDYRIPEKDMELFKKLKKAEERLDYDEIVSLLS